MKKDVSYIRRTRDYYRAQGYNTDYQWAQFDDTPFAALEKPLHKSRLAIITTSMPDNGLPKKSRTVISMPCDPIPTSMYTDDLSWDKEATHTKDVASYLPIEQLNQLVDDRVIGDLAPRFHCVPTEYSKRNTLETDAPELLRLCQEDQIDIALLVAL